MLRYEDVIFNKRALIGAITAHFRWTAEEAAVEKILSWADVRPAQEDPRAFIRQVSPGDHRRKLRPTTIRRLTQRMLPVMDLLGYSTD
jgi:hypothetical protein